MLCGMPGQDERAATVRADRRQGRLVVRIDMGRRPAMRGASIRGAGLAARPTRRSARGAAREWRRLAMQFPTRFVEGRLRVGRSFSAAGRDRGGTDHDLDPRAHAHAAIARARAADGQARRSIPRDWPCAIARARASYGTFDKFVQVQMFGSRVPPPAQRQRSPAKQRPRNNHVSVSFPFQRKQFTDTLYHRQVACGRSRC
jgi:hypothetical protein